MKIRCCAKSWNLFQGRILKTQEARSGGKSVSLIKKTVPRHENCDAASEMRHFCERDISAVYAPILLEICDIVVMARIVEELKF